MSLTIRRSLFKKMQSFFFLSILCAVQGKAQENDLTKYYPANALFKKLKVKSTTDTIGADQTVIYDREGFEISSYQQGNDYTSVYRYIKSKNSLKKYHYTVSKDEGNRLSSFETFIYNSAGKIITYQCVYISDYKSNKMEKFAYNERQQLISKSKYYLSQFAKGRPIDSLPLKQVYVYEYDTAGRIITIRETMGQPDSRKTDSLFYDSKNRLTKCVKRQETGYRGEMIAYDICRIEEYSYENNCVIESIFDRNEFIEETMQTYYANKLKMNLFYKGFNTDKTQKVQSYIYKFYK